MYNCSQCRFGVMELVGNIESNGTVSINLPEKENVLSINIFVCSRCGHAELRAGDRFLRIIKDHVRSLRKSQHKNVVM